MAHAQNGWHVFFDSFTGHALRENTNSCLCLATDHVEIILCQNSGLCFGKGVWREEGIQAQTTKSLLLLKLTLAPTRM